MKQKANRRFLYFVVLFNMIPLISSLPNWVLVLGLTFLVWRLLGEITKTPIPGRWLNLVLAILSVSLVFFHFGTLLGDEAGTSLLLLMTCLKLFEIRKYRDEMFVTYLCYFILMSTLIASQSLVMTVYMIVDVILITALLASHHMDFKDTHLRTVMRRAFKLSLQALPVIALVFFVFPRFTAGLWQRTAPTVGQMGFSDSLNPGSISQLIRSDQLAFRARFTNMEFPLSKVYWRGAVLSESRGMSWQKGESEIKDFILPLTEGSILTEIFLEPSPQRWLFTLDWPEQLELNRFSANNLVVRRSGRTFESRVEILGREYYRVWSQPATSLVQWEDEDPTLYLKVNDDQSPQAKEWAESKRNLPANEIVHEIQNFFLRNEFVYSLRPRAVKNMDQFLFESRQGFCEHYAGSMATLLRWAGVPARVIVGFQGGNPSLLGDYISVRYMDAHSWVEYWDHDRKLWVRSDPTSFIAPERLALGGERYYEFLASGKDQSAIAESATDAVFDFSFTSFYYRARRLADQLDASWINFLVSYDFAYQQELLKRFGWHSFSRWTFVLILTLGLVACVVILMIYFRKRNQKLSKSLALYQKLCRKLEKLGVPRELSEGPLSFCNKAIQRYPTKALELEVLFDEIMDIRYGTLPMTPTLEKKIKRQIRRLKIKTSESVSSQSLSP